MEVEAEPPCVRSAEAPFDKPTADVILRSSDLVDFRVRRGILAEASPFFDDMFTLPQTGGKRKRKEAGDLYEDGKPVVEMTEQSKVIRNLLLFCYPCDDPVLGDEVAICDVLEAARKYDMEEVAGRVFKRFGIRAKVKPWEMFALAYRHRWADAMQVAAKASLAFPEPQECPPYLADLPTGVYFKLRKYRQDCSAAVEKDNARALRSEHSIRPTILWLSQDEFKKTVPIECKGCVGIYLLYFDDYSEDDDEDYSEEMLDIPDWTRMEYYVIGDLAIELPHRDPIVDPKRIAKAAGHYASRCKECCEEVHARITKFATIIADRIDSVTSAVKLDIPT